MDARLRQMTFQTSPKWPFWPGFHNYGDTHVSVCRTETSESALEKFNAVVCGKKIFKFFATFFWGIFPYVFGKRHSFPLVSPMGSKCAPYA